MEENKKEEMLKTKENQQESFENELDSILENMPKEERHEVRKMIGMSMQMGGVISPQMELMKKMTPEHVSDFLDTQKKAMENQFKESRENKVFLFAVLLVTLVFVILLIFLLKDKPEVM